MPISTAIWTQPNDIDRELNDLGFTTAAMRDVALVWGTAMRSGTPHKPRTYPAYRAWADGTERLRDHGIKAGYTAQHERGVELCVNKQSGTAIVLCSGSTATGDSLRDPSTKHPRGTSSREVLLAQVALPWVVDKRPENVTKYRTWIFLARHVDGKIFTEFSWPATVSERGHIGRWYSRIVLPVLDMNAPRVGEGAREIVPSDEIDIVIKPRK